MNTLWPECEATALGDEPHRPPNSPVRGRAINGNGIDAVAFISVLRRQARFAAVIGKIPRFRAILSELFSGPIEIAVEPDPEILGKQYLVFTVQARGTIQEIAKLRRAWYNHTSTLLESEAEFVQLIITVTE